MLSNTHRVLEQLVVAGNTTCSDEDRNVYKKVVYDHIEIRSIGVMDGKAQLFECTDTKVYSPALKLRDELDGMIGKPGEIAIVPPRRDLRKQLSIFINYGHGDGRIIDAAIYPEQFWDFQDALGLGDGGAVVLLDGAGNELTALRKSSGAKVTQLQRDATGFVKSNDVFSVSARSEKYPIAAVAVVSASTVLASWKRSALTFAPIALLLASLSSWGLWRYGLKTRPMSESLVEAMETDALNLVYQPIIDVATGRATALEVLCRWTDPHRGEVSPDRFIAEAARDGVLPQLSAWVFTRAVAELRPLLAREPGFRVSINIGREDLVKDGALSQAMRKEAALLPRFTYEITERDSLAEMIPQAREVLNIWRAAGVRVALDDFGTGCCNLAYLRELPIDIVKIDRMFATSLDDANNTHDAQLFDATIRLLEERKLEIIVEGIERQTQHAALGLRHIAQAQGWFYARPMASGAINEWFQGAKTQSVPA